MTDFNRITRFIVTLLLSSIFFIGNVGGVIGIALIVISAIFAFESITSFCPFYKSNNLSTYKISEDYLEE